VKAFTLVQDVVRGIRNVRTENKLNPGKRIPAIIVAGENLTALQDQLSSIASLAALDTDALTLVETLAEKPADLTPLVVSGVEIYLTLADAVDLDAEKERLEKELAETQSQIKRLSGLLNSPFAQKAPAPVVEKEREKLAVFEETAAKLIEQLKNLG